MPEGLCPEPEMNAILERAGRGDAAGLAQVEASIARYGRDPRLHFLKGSLLASQQMYGDAQAAMTMALGINPDYWIARFQLGLLQLTSGDGDSARATWSRLHDLPESHYARTFARGLEAMIADDFPNAIALLKTGIQDNSELPAINRDMTMLIDQMAEKTGAAHEESQSEAKPAGEPVSATHFLLNVFKQKGRPN